MGTKKERRNYRIFRNYLDRMNVLRKPHETETEFVESAVHLEIERRELERRHQAQAA